MLAARDQENLVHGQQAAAASKALNRGTKHVPKTPGAKAPKTPFNARLHDENAIEAFGGGGGGGGGGKIGAKVLAQGGNMSGKQGAKERNAFITPMGPRTRAPLGFKTTNAKAKGFGTVKIEHGSNKTQMQEKDASARKPKPRIAQKETAKVLGPLEDEEREIEYMPPKAKEMPDYPDDFPPNTDFSILETLHKSTDWLAGSVDPMGYDGVTDLQRKLKIEAEERARGQQADEDLLAVEISNMKFPGMDSIVAANRPQAPKKRTDSNATLKKKKIGPSTSESRKAATALSNPARLASKPPAAAVQSRKIPKYPRGHSTTATVASKSTLGYANGRVASVSVKSHQKSFAVPSRTVSQENGQRDFTVNTFQKMVQDQAWDEEDTIDDKIKVPTLSELLRDDEAKEDFEFKL